MENPAIYGNNCNGCAYKQNSTVNRHLKARHGGTLYARRQGKLPLLPTATDHRRSVVPQQPQGAAGSYETAKQKRKGQPGHPPAHLRILQQTERKHERPGIQELHNSPETAFLKDNPNRSKIPDRPAIEETRSPSGIHPKESKEQPSHSPPRQEHATIIPIPAAAPVPLFVNSLASAAVISMLATPQPAIRTAENRPGNALIQPIRPRHRRKRKPAPSRQKSAGVI